MFDFFSHSEGHYWTIAGNDPAQITALAFCLIVAFIIGRVIAVLARRSAQRSTEKGRPAIAALFLAAARTSTLVLFTIGLKIGLLFLTLEGNAKNLADTIITVLTTVSVGYVLYCLVDFIDARIKKLASGSASKLDDMLAPLVRKSLKCTIVILTLLQIATLLSHQPLTSLLAGLGVGGLAIALAAQETLKNFFGSVVIFSDKPFELGERIVVDGHDGPVESVGFRSTRVRTLEGHLVTIPNGELANKTIQNIGKRPHIRRVLDLGVTYDTSAEKVEEAMNILKSLLENHEGMNEDFPPRVFFNNFGSISLDIRVLYWYHPADYWAYVEFSEKLNLEILRKFNEAGIEFAFPSQTMYLAQDENRPLSIAVSSD